MQDIQRNQLNKIIGTTVGYKGENLTIQKFKEVEDVVTVFTTSRNLNLLPDELEDFLENYGEPVSTVPAAIEGDSNVAIHGYQPSAENKALKETLMDALRRVQGEPAYIPQAKAIVEIANTMVNIQKTEIQMVQLAKRK